MSDREADIPDPTAAVPPLAGAGEATAADPPNRDLAAVLMAEQIELSILQRHHLRVQHVRDRFLVAFDMALALGGIVIISIIIALFWGAWTSRSVIVEPFDVPASFAQRGISGKVVASELLDRLKEFQAATRTNQQKRAVEDAWSNNIQLQIPEAGVSIADVEVLLHRWLSHDEHITGSVVEDGTNVVLTIRGDRFAAKSFSARPGQLHALAVRAAEYIYGQCEPYLFGVYLFNNGRDTEAIALAQNAFFTANRRDKPLLLSIWGNALADLGRYREALEKTREAIQLDPEFWLGYDGMMGDEQSLGEEEAVIDTGRDMARRAGRGNWFAANVPPEYWENIDYYLFDWPAFHRDLTLDMGENGGQGTQAAIDAPIDAEALARMHNWRAAELELETSPGSGTDHFVIAQSAFVRALIALDVGDAARAVTLLRIADSIARKDTAVAAEIATPWACWLALAESRANTGALVAPDLARGGHFVDCYRFKGDIADTDGNWAAAQTAYAAAAALAPSIPSSYESWGEALLRHGQRAEAIQKFAIAHEKGPHWADPLERWGETLAADGKPGQAISKYQTASKEAPEWGHLHLAWGRALDSLHRHSDALVEFNRAWSLDLSAADRASIAGCCRS